MPKSSLGRKSSMAAVASRKTGDYSERKAEMPALVRSTSVILPSQSSGIPRKRDFSTDRGSMLANRIASEQEGKKSEFGSTYGFDTNRPSTSRALSVSSGRASSISSKVGDTRPLTDKEWQDKAILTVMKALMWDFEGKKMSQIYKSLKPMSLAMFIDLCNYLLTKLDPKVEINRSNYLTELPFLLKKLMYKGKVDKMMLQTVNTMHTWPNVLGILHFLAELVNAAEDFKAMNLDPMYPDSIEGDISDGEELNFKHVVPVFLHLWNEAQHKNCGLEVLYQENIDRIHHAIQLSGFTNDVFEEENKQKNIFLEAKKKNQELTGILKEAKLKRRDITDKLKVVNEKNDVHRKELDDLNAAYQKELQLIAELENEVKYMDDEAIALKGIMSQYESTDQNNMTPEEYDNYKTKKQNIQEEIKFEKNTLFELGEVLTEATFTTHKVRKECEKLHREYNSKLNELIKDDLTVTSALSYTRPRLGQTPCNEATAKLLEKTLGAYKEKISTVEEELNTSEDSSHQFKLNEEKKEKEELLSKLKAEHMKTCAEQDKLKGELLKKLLEITEENEKLDEEIRNTKELLDKNHTTYLEKEKELKTKETKLQRFHSISQRKLEIRYETIVELDKKLKVMMDELKADFNNVSQKLDEVVNIQ